MAFCDSLDDAIVYATPQVGSVAAGTLTASKTPSLATATTIWGQQAARVLMCVASAGLDPSTIAAGAKEWAQAAEAALTSGEVLLAKTSIGAEGLEQALALINRGEEQLAALKRGADNWQAMRAALLSQGASALALPASGRVASNWTAAGCRREDDDRTTDHDEPAPIFPDPPGETAL